MALEFLIGIVSYDVASPIPFAHDHARIEDTTTPICPKTESHDRRVSHPTQLLRLVAQMEPTLLLLIAGSPSGDNRIHPIGLSLQYHLDVEPWPAPPLPFGDPPPPFRPRPRA